MGLQVSGFEAQGEAGERTGKLCLVSGEQKRAGEAVGAGLGEVAFEAPEHGVSRADVEVGEGFVEQKEVGRGEQDAGERGALAHALRVFTEPAWISGIEVHFVEGLGDSVGADLRGEGGLVQAEEVVEVFGGGKVVVKHGAVAHVGDAAAELARRLAEDGDGAVGGVGEAGE